MSTTEFSANIVEHTQCTLYLVVNKGLVYLDSLQHGCERGVSAVVRPIGVEDTQFGLCGVALLFGEIVQHLTQVVGVHRQPPLLAERCQVLLFEVEETVQLCQRFDVGVLYLLQL